MRLFKNADKNSLFVILEGVAFAMIFNLYNPFVQMFAKRLGAGDMHVALINSIPPLIAILVLIPCGILIDRIEDKKRVTGILILINSIFYIVIATVPFLPDRYRVVIYIILIGLMNWPGSLYNTTWQSFFAGTFKGTQARLVYSLRSKYGAFLGLITVLVTGLILTNIPKNDAERLMIYQIFYAVCFILAIIQAFFLSRVKIDRDINNGSIEHIPPFNISDFKYMLLNKKFMTFSAISFAFHVSWQMAWPLFFIYYVDYVKVNEFQLGMINVASGLTAFLSYSLWNKFINKKGSSFVIMFGAAAMAVNPFFFLGQADVYTLLLINTAMGIANAGYTLTLFSGLLDILPENKRTVYISFFNTFVSISGFISPLMGIWAYRGMGIHKAFLLIGMLRVFATFLYVINWVVERRIEKKRPSRSEVSA